MKQANFNKFNEIHDELAQNLAKDIEALKRQYVEKTLSSMSELLPNFHNFCSSNLQSKRKEIWKLRNTGARYTNFSEVDERLALSELIEENVEDPANGKRPITN